MTSLNPNPWWVKVPLCELYSCSTSCQHQSDLASFQKALRGLRLQNFNVMSCGTHWSVLMLHTPMATMKNSIKLPFPIHPKSHEASVT